MWLTHYKKSVAYSISLRQRVEKFCPFPLFINRISKQFLILKFKSKLLIILILLLLLLLILIYMLILLLFIIVNSINNYNNSNNIFINSNNILTILAGWLWWQPLAPRVSSGICFISCCFGT